MYTHSLPLTHIHVQMVSTSRTPGHTKHFQTIFLSRSVRLCDCPGLVFPSLVEKQLQVSTASHTCTLIHTYIHVHIYTSYGVNYIDFLLFHRRGADSKWHLSSGSGERALHGRGLPG